jgi:sulfur transfer complex TusBCD TusB component (DsrH family)
MIEKQSQHHEITIVLIQEAVHLEEQLPSRVIALTEDLWRKGLDGKIPEISYGELLTLIFNHDRVFCW